jgi:hypothetical protein
MVPLTRLPNGLGIVLAMAIAVMASSPLAAAPTGKDTKPDSKRLRQLRQERVEALEEQLQGAFERVKIGKDPLIQFIEAIRELAEAELDVAETTAAKVTAVEKMVRQLQDCEEQVKQLQVAGLQTKQGVAQARAARLKAEIQLEILKGEK